MLFATFLLRHLDAMGREGAVLRHLDQPPPVDLTQLYDDEVRKCMRRTGDKYNELVMALLHGVACASRPLVLDEIVSLSRWITKDPAFQLEEIPEPFEKFLQVGEPGTDLESKAKLEAQGGYGTTVSELEKAQEAASPDKIYDDGTLAIKFYERSMRSYFNGADYRVGGLRWSYSQANRYMFLTCVALATPTSGDQSFDLDSRLVNLAAQGIFYHWRVINPDKHSPEENAEVMAVLSKVLLNETGFAEMAEKMISEFDYNDIFVELVFNRIIVWAKLLNGESANVRSCLSEKVISFWEPLAESPKKCLYGLIRAHLQRLPQAPKREAAIASYKAMQKALKIVSAFSCSSGARTC